VVTLAGADHAADSVIDVDSMVKFVELVLPENTSYAGHHGCDRRCHRRHVHHRFRHIRPGQRVVIDENDLVAGRARSLGLGGEVVVDARGRRTSEGLRFWLRKALAFAVCGAPSRGCWSGRGRTACLLVVRNRQAVEIAGLRPGAWCDGSGRSADQ